MRNSPILLTKTQLDFASSTEYPLLKHSIIHAVTQLFGELGEHLEQTKPGGIAGNSKISKGEQHEQMPYVVLDYPRIDPGNLNVLCRTLFWWGHYFSFNLLVRRDRIGNLNPVFDQPVHVLQTDQIWQNQIRHGYIRSASPDLRALNLEFIRITQTLPIADYEKLTIQSDCYGKWLNALDYRP